jgi:spermidine synthase
MLLKSVIFVSGGAILALELLASRIMTPYFGVSLYIWTGILSITLVALALGYWAGGRLAGTAVKGASAARLAELFALMPAVSALAIIAACLAYPFLFAPLANWSLVFGAFVACVALLFVPLVAASAMNPLLVAIFLNNAHTKAADAGAGGVFFVSTLGSVAGVLITAFGLIPYVSNYAAALIVAIVLAALTLALAAFPPPTLKRKKALWVTGLTGLIAAALLWWQADAYTGRLGPVSYGGKTWRVETTERSLFGTVKILKHEPDPGTGRFWRIYFQDGLTQNSVESSGHSRSFYTYALEALARAYRPGMKHALVMGLGAGMVPTGLAARGTNVEVVEIDTSSVRIASRIFGLDTGKIKIHETDARTFARTCPRRYDVVVVDLFHGDGTPDYLVTREFFRDLKRCVAADGVAVFNTFADLDHPASYAHLLVTLRSELPHLALYRPHVFSSHINSFIVAAAAPLTDPVKVTFDYVPSQHDTMLWDMLAKPTDLSAKLFDGGKIISDAWNPAAFELANSQMIYRRSVVEGMPAAFLLN